MNLKEFSKKTGISISTISKALSNYKDVNINTKNKVIALAKEFNYVPNIYAKALASRTNFSVGLVLPLTFNSIQKLTLINFLENIYSKLNKVNIPVMMIFAKNKKEELDAFEKLINFHKVGLILLNDIKQNDERVNYLEKKSIGYITWGRCNKDSSKYSWIDEDIEYGSNLAVDYLLSKGHKNIGYLSSSIKTNYFVQRKKYFVSSLKRNNISVNKSNFIEVNHSNQNEVKNKIKELLNNQNKITALLASSPTFAMDAIDVCNKENKKIGKNFSLLSFDSNILASLAPNITTIRQPVIEMNEYLYKIIQSKISNFNKNYNYMYKSKLDEKDSVLKIN